MKLNLPKLWFSKRIDKEEGEVGVGLEPIKFDNPKTGLSTKDILAQARRESKTVNNGKPFELRNYLLTAGTSFDELTQDDLEKIIQQAFDDGRACERSAAVRKILEYKFTPSLCHANLAAGKLIEKARYLAESYGGNEEEMTEELANELEICFKHLERDLI